MAAWQGPALCCYNDAVFSPSDLRALSKIGQDSKLDKPGATGRCVSLLCLVIGTRLIDTDRDGFLWHQLPVHCRGYINIWEPPSTSIPLFVCRFGLGWNAVYHFTDVPSFCSGGNIVWLDPHAKCASRASLYVLKFVTFQRSAASLLLMESFAHAASRRVCPLLRRYIPGISPAQPGLKIAFERGNLLMQVKLH